MNKQSMFLISMILFVGTLKTFATSMEEYVLSSVNDSVARVAIDVEYKEPDRSGLIWKDELELARIIPTLDGKGIRITLPNSDPAKIIILDKKGKKKLKTISYVAPAVIDISDLRKGSYQLIMESHRVIVVKTFQKDRK